MDSAPLRPLNDPNGMAQEFDQKMLDAIGCTVPEFPAVTPRFQQLNSLLNPFATLGIRFRNHGLEASVALLGNNGAVSDY